MGWTVSEISSVVTATTGVGLLVVTVWYARTAWLEYRRRMQPDVESGLAPRTPSAPNALRRWIADAVHRAADRLAPPPSPIILRPLAPTAAVSPPATATSPPTTAASSPAAATPPTTTTARLAIAAQLATAARLTTAASTSSSLSPPPASGSARPRVLSSEVRTD